MTSERIFIVVGAVLAVVLQVLVAPYMAVFSAMPNFVVAFAVVVAVVRPVTYGPVLPFALGMAFDFVGGGPLGAMAFSLTLFCYLLARYCESAANDSPLMSLAFAAVGLLAVELSYAVFLLLFGYSANMVEALAYRVAPCFVYDLVVMALVYPIARRFAQPGGVVRADITQLR